MQDYPNKNNSSSSSSDSNFGTPEIDSEWDNIVYYACKRRNNMRHPLCKVKDYEN
ncbi:hypothetical protein MKX01_008034, partial [Papaver californicum]